MLNKVVSTLLDKKVVFLSMGGTILCEKTENGLTPETDPKKLIMKSLNLQNEQESSIEVNSVAKIDSSMMTTQKLQILFQEVHKQLQELSTLAVIITTGTDTMEILAYFLSVVNNIDKPIIITGAQKSADDENPDGPKNIKAAFNVANSPEAKGKGVMVVFADAILPARYVKKTHTEKLDTLKSPLGPIGNIDEQNTVVFHPIETQKYLTPKNKEISTEWMLSESVEYTAPKIRTFHEGVEEDASAIDDAINSKAEVIILDAYGAGNVNQATVDKIEKYKDDAIFILTSQCGSGNVSAIYGAAGGGVALANLGVVFGGDLQMNKIRTLVSLFLSQPNIKTLSREEKIQKLSAIFADYQEN